jgi:hypothetical protein
MNSSRLSGAGAANVRFNALKHGLTSRQVVVKGEDPAEYDRMKSDLYTEYASEEASEAFLVDQLAQCQWRLRRARIAEQQFFAMNMEEFFAGKPDEECAMGPASVVVLHDREYEKIRRYTTYIERAYFRTLSELTRIQSLRTRPVQKMANAGGPSHGSLSQMAGKPTTFQTAARPAPAAATASPEPIAVDSKAAPVAERVENPAAPPPDAF